MDGSLQNKYTIVLQINENTIFFWTAQQELRTIMNFGGRSLFVQKIFRGVLAAFNMLFKVVSFFFFFFNSCIYLAALSLSCGR